MILKILMIRTTFGPRFIIKCPFSDKPLYYQGKFWSTSRFNARGFRTIMQAFKKANQLEIEFCDILDLSHFSSPDHSENHPVDHS